MRLNLGCGLRYKPGWLNVDHVCAPGYEPDALCDLEKTPWPWDDSSASEVVFEHSLEHLGQTPRDFLAIMQELYRVCAPGAVVTIIVPHPRHDDFLNDPTHVRAITPRLMELFDKQICLEAIKRNASNSPLALSLGVDFEMFEVNAIVDPGWIEDGNPTGAPAIEEAATRFNNVLCAYHIKLRVRK